MPTEYGRRENICEGFLLLIAAPFLLFPHYSILATAVALVLVIALWLWPILLLRSTLLPATPYNVTFLVFLSTVLVGVLVTAYPDLTLPKATGLILGLSLWRYLVGAVQDRLQLTWAIFGYIVMGFAFTLTGFLNADWLSKASSQVPYLQQLLTDVFSQSAATPNLQMSVHPNQIAGTVTLYLPLLISILTSSSGFRKHKFVVIALATIAILTSAALLLTQSRSGWIGVASSLVLLVILRGLLMPPSGKRKAVWISIGILFLFGVIIIGQVGPERIQQYWLNPPQSTMIGSLTTLRLRQELWPWAITTLTNFPFTGVGIGSFGQVVRNLYPVNISPDFVIAHAHNMILHVALNIGLPGLISYISLLLLSGVVGWGIATKGNEQLQAISLGLLCSLVAFHIYGLFDALALGSKSGLLLWGILGLLAALNHIGTHQQKLND